MDIGGKEEKILTLLLQTSGYVTAVELANKLNVSEKTIYRSINNLNSNCFGEDIIISYVGKGFKIDYDKYIKNKFSNYNDLSTPNKRRKQIMLKILFKSPNPSIISDLFKNYYLSASSVRNDISIIENYMSNRSIKIEKNNTEIIATGEEDDIRKTINQLLLDVDYLSDYNKILNEITDKHRNSEDIEFIMKQMDFLEESLGKEIPYPYDINLVIHIYILIKRFREGNVDFSCSNNNKELYLPCKEKKIVQKCIDNISFYLGSHVPDSEYNYLGKYISSAGLVKVEKSSDDISYKITEFYMNSYFDSNLNNIDKEQLFENLLLHVEPMVYRIINEIEIKNTLLFEIKNEYSELFKELKLISKAMEKEFNITAVSEDEIGYLVVYFAKYKELVKKHNKNILIVCSSGIGTSEFLKVKVKNTYPSLNIVRVISARRIEKEFPEYQDVDLILTTVNLNENITIPNILVSSLFTVKDQERVNNFFKGELLNG